jgi:hypothetical protein
VPRSHPDDVAGRIAHLEVLDEHGLRDELRRQRHGAGRPQAAGRAVGRGDPVCRQANQELLGGRQYPLREAASAVNGITKNGPRRPYS